MISKERLVFDPANESEGDMVAAFLKGQAGFLITSTNVGGKESIDVNVANAIAVDLDAASDSVQAWAFDGSGNVINSTSNALNVFFTNTSLAVTATDLDIRNLEFATDTVDVTGSAVSIAGDVNVTQGTSPWVVGDGGGSLTVDASNLDIRDLAAATDSVAAYLKDGSGNSISSSGGALDINIQSQDSALTVSDAALANASLLNTQKNVTDTSGALLASQLSGRKYLLAQNLGNRSIYVGGSGVTVSDGIRLSPGSQAELRLGAALSLHAVTDSGTQDVRLLEIA